MQIPFRPIVAFALAFFALNVSQARAQDILHTAATSFFEPEDRFKRIGIEMEMSGLGFGELERHLAKYFDIRSSKKISDVETHLQIDEGVIKLKVEGQAWRYEEDPVQYARQLAEDLKIAPREVVFPPLTYQRAIRLQDFATDIEAAGAIGTRADHAVAFQVNYEFGPLREDPRRVRDLVDLLRTYYDPANMRQIDDALQVPEMRREFLNDLTRGFRKKLFDPSYTPDLQEFFEDYLYRQSAELFGFREAWTAPISKLSKLLGQLKDPVHPTILKMQRVRVSSLLLEAFPEDPLVKRVIESRWAVPAPIIEFREFNMVFKNVDRDIRTCIGLVNSVKKYGYYRYDRLMSALSGVPASDFPRIRRKVKEGKPFIVRYLLEDPKIEKMTAAERAVPGSVALWTQLSAEHPGRMPLDIGGESIVVNRRHIHRTSIVGKYNPGLDHGYIQQALENKLTEAKIFGEYAPGTMPKYVALRDILSVNGKKVTAEAVYKAASKSFGAGWVMKGSWDLGSENSFISNQIDFTKSLQAYRNGFEDYRKKVLLETAGNNPETILNRLKEHPGYLGWKIHSMLESPNQVFFQEMIPIDREFRVELLNGKVIPGATIDRYAYLKKKARPPSAAELREIEEFTQKVFDGLPPVLKILPYGLDVARLKTGGFRIIETNPGGNSSFLEESYPSVKAYEKALFEYREEVNAGRAPRLTPREEMAWLKNEFGRLKISPAKDYPGMVFMSAGIFDPEYFPLGECPSLLKPKRRWDRPSRGRKAHLRDRYRRRPGRKGDRPEPSPRELPDARRKERRVPSQIEFG